VFGMALNSAQRRRALSSRRNFPLPAPSCVSSFGAKVVQQPAKNSKIIRRENGVLGFSVFSLNFPY